MPAALRRNVDWRTGQEAVVTQDFAIPAIPAPDPLPPPDALQVIPLAVDAITVERLGIPPLQIDPIEGKTSNERGR